MLEAQATQTQHSGASQEPVDELARDRGRVGGEGGGTVDDRRLSG
jgi:hypothetical protein